MSMLHGFWKLSTLCVMSLYCLIASMTSSSFNAVEPLPEEQATVTFHTRHDMRVAVQEGSADFGDVVDHGASLERGVGEEALQWTSPDPLEAPSNLLPLLEKVAQSVKFKKSTKAFDDKKLFPKGEPRICAFMCANAEDIVHAAEVRAVLDTWGSEFYMYLWTEKESIFRADSNGEARLLVNLTGWSEEHAQRVNYFRFKKGQKGRGREIIPLYYYIFTRYESMFSHCDWIFKADSDSYVNKRMLVRQLKQYNPSDKLYIGTQGTVNRTEYSPNGFTWYAYGGTGYMISRGLVRGVDLTKCIRYSEKYWVWLVYEDTSMGYCFNQLSEGVKFQPLMASMATTRENYVEEVVEHAFSRHRTRCLRCAQGLHPVGDQMMHTIHTWVNRKSVPPDCSKCNWRRMKGDIHMSTSGKWSMKRKITTMIP